jgi:hypothetical protein
MLCWHVHHTCRCSCTISAVSRLDMTWHFMCQCWSYCGSAYCHRDAKRWWPCAARPMHKIHSELPALENISTPKLGKQLLPAGSLVSLVT